MVLIDTAPFDGEAIAETVVFLGYFNELPDNRQRSKVMYPLAEVLLLCLSPGCRRISAFSGP
jgi:hypothetical protein